MGALLSLSGQGPILRALRALPQRALLLYLALALLALLAGALAVSAPLELAILLWGAAWVAGLSLAEPLVGLGAALVFAPFQAWLAMSSVLTPQWVGHALWLVAVGAWAIRASVRRHLRFRPLPIGGALVLFIGTAWLSLWQPFDAWSGFTELLKWLQLLVTVWITFDRLVGDGVETQAARVRVIGLLGALGLAALLQSLIGVWQAALRGDGPAYFMIDEGIYRAYGTFEQPNPFGGFLGIVAALWAGLLVCAAWAWLSGHRRSSGPSLPWLLLGAAGLLLVGLALFASWSRGAWMGFGAALLVLAASLPRRRFWGWLAVIVVVLGGGIAYRAGWLPAAISGRLTGFLEYTRFEDVRGVGINDANFAVLERMAHWQSALDMARDRFWLGVGLGCYEAAYPTYMLPNWALPLGHAHNVYLNVLAETGFLGLIAYGILMGTICVSLLRATQVLDGFPRWLAVGLLAAWTHFWVHNLVDNLLVNMVHLHIGVLLALTAWLTTLADNARGAHRSALLRAAVPGVAPGYAIPRGGRYG